MIRRIAILVLFETVVCFCSFAQSTTGSLLGVVRDASGAVVPNAQITAEDAQTSLSRTTTSDSTGAYLITNLPVGQYQLRVEAQGFQSFVQNGITLVVDQSARVDVDLTVGAASQTVQVTGQSTGVDTQTATVGELVDRVRIQELPLDGRNAMTLAAVVPGVTNILAAPTSETQSRSGPSITIAGGRDTQNELRFDDQSWKNITQNTLFNLPSPDALQEFQILTSSSSAEYGRGGGGVIIAVTRAGTNQFHAALWEYLRNTVLNGRNYFATTKPELNQDQYGFTFGGPILKNKFFFFGSFQGTNIRQGELLATALPPTTAQRSGDFGPLTIKDPNGGTFPGGIIPASRFDPVAVNVLSMYMPPANASGGRLVQLVPNPTNDYQYLWRLDYNLHDNDLIDLRFFQEDSALTSQAGNVADYDPDVTGLDDQGWALQDTHTFGPTLVNEARLSVGRANSTVRQLNHTQLSDLGAIFPGVITPQLPNITVSGYYTLATTNLFVEHDNIYQVGDTLHWNRGRHSVSLGGEFERLELYNFGSSGNNGTFSFTGQATGNAFADFLLGKAVTALQASPYSRNGKSWDWYAFVQDDFRLKPRLTVNLGVRYAWFRPFQMSGNRTNTYRAGQQSTITPGAPLGMVFPGDAGIGPGLVPTDTDNVAPRIGLAWDPMGDGRTSIRAAYGLFFEDLRSDIFTYPAVNQPFVISNTVNEPYSLQNPYFGYQDPFPYVYSPQTAKFYFPMSLFTVPTPTLNAPWIHNFSLSIERTLPLGVVLNVGYVAKLEHNLIRMVQSNPSIYIPGESTLANTNQRRTLLPGIYSSFRTECMCSNGNYNALQVSVSRRYNNGLTFMLSYNHGKLLDEYSATNLGQTPQNPADPHGDYSRSDYDVNEVGNGSIVYAIPFFPGAKRPLTSVFGGWSVSSIVSLATGLPILIQSGQDFSLTGVDYDRPNWVGSRFLQYTSKSAKVHEFFNTAAFVPNTPGHYGDTGRNPFSGPGQATTNISLVKTIPIGGRFGRVQFRSEFFNAFNHTNFGQPDGVMLDSTFARIQTAADPRIIQFALRYQF